MDENHVAELMIESLYSSLPQIFRDEDFKQKLFLKRLLSVLVYGGFFPYVEDVQKLYQKYDSSKWSKEDIRKFAKDFGWEFDERLSIEYQRRLVSHMMELFKLRGTKPCINYVSNDMTGHDCIIMENYEGNPEEVGIKLFADENEAIPNYFTRSSIGFFLPFYCMPLLIIHYNFFQNEPLEFHDHELNINLDFYSESNPWELTISEPAYFNGLFNFDGDINFSGGKGGDGPQHQVFFTGKHYFEIPIGSNEIILSPIFDGYFSFNGRINFDNELKTQKVLCMHENNYGIIKNIDTEPLADIEHDLHLKTFQINTFNGKFKFDGEIDFSGQDELI